MAGELRSGELVLFFQIDDEDKVVRRGLKMLDTKCCDGLVFYARDGEKKKIICLVELKSNDLGDAAEQISITRNNLAEILQAECHACSDYLSYVIWKACIYRYSSSPKQVSDCKNTLRRAGFKENDIILLRGRDNDLGPSLRSI